MLKIKDNVSLDELKKYGFKKKYYNGSQSFVLEFEKKLPRKHQDIIFELPSRKLGFCNWGSDVMFDLIKADLVEKVGDE